MQQVLGSDGVLSLTLKSRISLRLAPVLILEEVGVDGYRKERVFLSLPVRWMR